MLRSLGQCFASLVLSWMMVESAKAATLTTGDRVVANSDIAVRATPAHTAQLLGTHPPGVLGTLAEGPVVIGKTAWWRVDYEGVLDGWSPAARLSGGYFPVPESEGGWRSLVGATDMEPEAVHKDRIRKVAGVDWDKLKRAQDYSLEFSGASSLLVIRNGWVAGEWGPTGRVGVGSVSKSLTGLALAKLFDLSAEGAMPRSIAPEAFVYSHLPSEWWLSDLRKRQIRFDHLLTMSSGLVPDDRPGQDDYLGLVMAQPVRTAPEREWSYQSATVDLVGIAMQQITGKTVQELFDEHIGSQLGVAPFTWGSFASHTRASSGAQTTPRDLARVGHLMMMNGRWSSGSSQAQVVSAANIAYLRRGPGCVQSAIFRATPDSPFMAEPTSPQFYGRLWWTNLRGTALGPAVPSDAFYALGLREKLLIVVPSLNLIVVRIGDAPTTVVEFRRELMKRIMAAVTGPATSYNGSRVASLSLVDARNGKPVTLCDPMPPGAVIELAKLPPRSFALRANTVPKGVGSLHFQQRGPAAARRAGANGPMQWSFARGRHSVTVTPYNRANLAGLVGLPFTQHYLVK